MVELISDFQEATPVTVGTTATALPATALSGRISVLITNNGAVTVFLGGSSSVTTSNGTPLEPADQISFEAGDLAIIYGIVASSTADVRILEAK